VKSSSTESQLEKEATEIAVVLGKGSESLVARTAPGIGRSRSSAETVRGVMQWVIPVLVVLAILGVWQLMVPVMHWKPYFIPSPTKIAATFKDNFRYILDNCVPTIGQAALGFAVGNAAAIVMSVWFVHATAARRVFYPLVIFLQSIPLIAIFPIAIVVLGNGLTTKIVMIALITFFPTLVTLMRGLSAVDANMLQLFQSVHASRWKIFTKLRWPNALPYLFAGLRITASVALLGAVIVEWIGSDTGLGYLIINATYQFDTPFLFAATFATAFLVLIAFGIVVAAERLLVPWARTADIGQ
jgi:NitT/TauT family transport system permease protein